MRESPEEGDEMVEPGLPPRSPHRHSEQEAMQGGDEAEGEDDGGHQPEQDRHGHRPEQRVAAEPERRQSARSRGEEDGAEPPLRGLRMCAVDSPRCSALPRVLDRIEGSMGRCRPLIRLCALLAAVALTKGCGDGDSAIAPPPDPPRPTTVAVSPATAEFSALGASVQLTAEVRDQSGNVMAGAAVAWSSTAASVATVDAAGLVTAVANGTATITAASGGVSGTAAVTVTQALDSVAVSPTEATIAALGDTVRLAAEAFDANGHAVAGAEFSWESSAASVATVDVAGLVTAVAGGAATIIAMAGEASGTTEIMVIDMEWAADFVARQHVVDVMNVGARVDPNCTADCERTLFPGDGRRDLGGIREVTGIDMSMTNPGQGNYPEQFSDGRVANVRVVRTYADIEVAREDGDFAIMWYLQTRPATGRWQLGGDVATLRDWYDEGLRVLQIAYGSRREDARGPDEQLGYGAGEGDERGVTDLGRFAIAEMNQLGMIVDCSHCNRQTTLDAAAMSTKPILANHANAEALTPHDRNKTDEELMAIAATGGVIGVTPIRLFLDTDGDGVTGMDDMIAHIEYIASLVGIDHVGIATDTYVDGWEPSSHHYASADLAALDRWVRLTARLRARGWSEEDLAKLLGRNFLRVFREVLRPR